MNVWSATTCIMLHVELYRGLLGDKRLILILLFLTLFFDQSGGSVYTHKCTTSCRGGVFVAVVYKIWRNGNNIGTLKIQNSRPLLLLYADACPLYACSPIIWQLLACIHCSLLHKNSSVLGLCEWCHTAVVTWHIILLLTHLLCSCSLAEITCTL